jgi:hypothetical protein
VKNKRKKRTEAEKPQPIEIRNHANGRLDEIVACGVSIHLEQMDSNYWWMGLEIAGRRFPVRFNSAKGIRVTADEDTSDGVTRHAPRDSNA